MMLLLLYSCFLKRLYKLSCLTIDKMKRTTGSNNTLPKVAVSFFSAQFCGYASYESLYSKSLTVGKNKKTELKNITGIKNEIFYR